MYVTLNVLWLLLHGCFMTVVVTIIAINNFTRRVSYDFMSRTANTILILKKNNITVYKECIELIFETHYYSHDIYTYTLHYFY